MEHVAEQDQFIAVAPAAATIFSYARSTPELSNRRLKFEYAMIDRQSSRAVAKFACASCRQCAIASVWISAMTQLDGNWALSHSIDWRA